MFRKLKKFFPNKLPDHDINDLKVSKTSTAWEHIRVCPKCKCKTEHQEFMTRICLSCGSDMSEFPYNAAIRKIVKNGVWIKNLRLHNRNYFFVNDEWKIHNND